MMRALILTSETWLSLTEAGKKALPREIGGVLLGHYTKDGPIITDAPVVPDPRATRVRYRRDAESAGQILNEQVHADTSGLLGYLGEWHTHPLPIGPSKTDELSTLRLAAAGNHDVALLVLALGTRGWTGHGRLVTPTGDVHNAAMRLEERPR